MYWFWKNVHIHTVHVSQNAPVCVHNIFRCVIYEHMSYRDISIIVADFLCGQVSSYDFVDVSPERRCVDLLYYLRKYSHTTTILEQMRNFIVTCA